MRATHAFLAPHDIDALRPLVAAELAGDGIEWWVAMSANAVVGFLGYASGTIEALFIDPSYQRKGVGSCLVEHAQRIAGGSLAVDVNEQNDDALRFYSALGFSVVGRSPVDTAGRPFPLLHMKRPQA